VQPSDGHRSVFPSASVVAPTLVELGPPRNGLGSLRNLELLLKSIKVGQKGLFAAVAAVHADCAEMIASLGSVSHALESRGTEPEVARHLSDAICASLMRLEAALAQSVRSGRLSATHRLALEQDLPRLSREIGGTLPLVALVDRAAQPRPPELTPAAWVHLSSAEGPPPEGVPAFFEASGPDLGLPIDLAAAKLLVVLACALLAQRSAPGPLRLQFASEQGLPRTRLGFGAGSGPGIPVRIAALQVVESTLYCAHAAARRLGGSFEYVAEARRVCISWPLS
jgi:hypothetical protein